MTQPPHYVPGAIVDLCAQAADPLDVDDGAYWFITDRGRAALSPQA